MIRYSILALIIASLFLHENLYAKKKSSQTAQTIKMEVDWAAFLARHDIVWEILPARFDHGIYHGNGLLGCMIFRDGPNIMRWEMGRSDITEHRRDNNRLPIGGMLLETKGTITGGSARLNLWNAESSGEIITDRGTIGFRTLIHSENMFALIEITCSEGERGASFRWEAKPAKDAVNASFGDPPNPEPETGSVDGIMTCTQKRYAGGEFSTAWKEMPAEGAGKRRVFISIADRYPGTESADEAAGAVKKAIASDYDKLIVDHRNWWHGYYPKSFLSVPDMKVEGFYWAQVYKLACATRSDRQVMDLLGPWFRQTGWPRIWWNLNIQICYSPVYAANHLELGESFTKFIDAKRHNFVKNAKDIWKFDNCATVPHTTDYEGLRGDGSRAPDHYINPGDFTWAMHNYWQHYRHTMDNSMVTDTVKHAFYPLLKGSINLYIKLLSAGEDGKLHLPVMHSPEYGNDSDNNYNLSLLRWGCHALLEMNRRYSLNDPQTSEWENVLRNLTPYPEDSTGLRIGSAMQYEKSHRHWSHLLMMYPLYLINHDQPENRNLMNRTVEHWLTAGEGKGIFGWSRAAASSIYSSMGKGEQALDNLNRHLNDKRFVMPNAMYIEGAPVIECAFVAARSIQDMLLQSWGTFKEEGYRSVIRIFPALPEQWKDAVIHNMSAEGAFIVSAVRSGGTTRWVRIKSLAGEPCLVRPGMEGKLEAFVNDRKVRLKGAGDVIYIISLKKGDEIILTTESVTPVVSPVEADRSSWNVWGLKKDMEVL